MGADLFAGLNADHVVVWLLAVFAQTVFFAISGTWWASNLLNKMKDDFRTELAEARKEVDHSIAGVENDTRQAMLSLNTLITREIADVSKTISDHEKFTRDNFVRNDIFNSAIDRVFDGIKTLTDSMTASFNRIDSKFDAIMSQREDRRR